jgi:hypothetical protein
VTIATNTSSSRVFSVIQLSGLSSLQAFIVSGNYAPASPDGIQQTACRSGNPLNSLASRIKCPRRSGKFYGIWSQAAGRAQQARRVR